MSAAVAAMILAPVTFRPPAIPLITHTPYFSAWCMSDKLTDGWPRHWTGGVNAAQGLVRIDDTTYRWMGTGQIPALEQTSVEVTPTRSIFTFAGAGIELQVEFLSPLFSDEVEMVARPLSYVTTSARSTDGEKHQVAVYLDFSGEWVVDDAGKQVYANRHRLEGLEALTMRAARSEPLNRSGDQVMADWATLAVAAPHSEGAISNHLSSRQAFAASGNLPRNDDLNFPRMAGDNWPVIALRLDLGGVDGQGSHGYAMVAMDEMEAVEYFRRPLPPFWKRKGQDLGELLRNGASDYPRIREKSLQFDKDLMARLDKTGGPAFAQMGAIAYRQCLAGHGLVEDLDGDLLMFSKENSSNGCMGTVDVTFPASPFFLALNPALLEAQLRPIFEYSASSRWPWRFAPHDIGQYPLANGQVYGGGERTEENQMPVEESANMILMTAGLVKEGRPELAKTYQQELETWADYLAKHGIDPANQLCTDDFSGHLARNANLSAKAILALAAMKTMGLDKEKKYENAARDGVAFWFREAGTNPSKLAFGAAGTWGIKYNIVWDKILGTNLFSQEFVESELAFYATQANEYGIPLDNRASFTKVDWIFWAASMGGRDTQDRMIEPILKMLNSTTDRVPFTDWSDTKTARNSGFKARTVIGGIYMPLYMRDK